MKGIVLNRRVIALAFCVAASALLWHPATAQSAEGTAVIKIKAASPPHPVVHRLTKDAYQLFGDEVERRTNGKVKFTWFFGDSLVKMPQSYESVQSGVVDLCIVAAFNYPHIFKIVEGLGLPFTVQGAAHSADIAWKMYQTMPEMQQEMKGIKFLGAFTTDVINLSAKDKLVKTLDDMKNLRVAVGSGQVAEMAQLLGMAAQPVGYADVYMSLHRGMADATLFPNAPLRSYKITELTNTHTIANFKVDPMVIAMRKETWDKLPPDVQKVFNELTPSFARLCGHTLTNEGLWVLDALKQRGDEFYTPPPDQLKKWKEAVKPMYDIWIKKLNGSGMNGQAIFDRLNEIAEQTNVSDTPEDEWWKQGRIGKKTSK
jgi:TRAP-type C4-dicarboxylate transport system substrate-binding protein